VGRLITDRVRPLAAIVEHVNRHGPSVVTYEDIPYESAAVRDDGSLTDRRGAIAPLELDIDDVEVARAPGDVLRRAVLAYEQLGNPGRFAVLEAAPMIHVVGSSLDRSGGRGWPEGAPLAHTVTLSGGSGTAGDFVVEFVNALGRDKVELGQRPFNVLGQRRMTWASQHGPARDLLRALALGFADPLSFSLLYDFDSSRYVLNMQSGLQRRASARP
jgi:hypothetical protein